MLLSVVPAPLNDITFRERQLARTLLAVLSKRPQAPAALLTCTGYLSSNYVQSGHFQYYALATSIGGSGGILSNASLLLGRRGSLQGRKLWIRAGFNWLTTGRTDRLQTEALSGAEEPSRCTDSCFKHLENLAVEQFGPRPLPRGLRLSHRWIPCTLKANRRFGETFRRTLSASSSCLVWLNLLP